MSFRFWVDIHPAIIQPRSAAKVSPQGDEPLPRVTSLAGNAPRARTHQPTDQGGTPFDPYLWGCNKILRTTITKAEEDCPSSTAANIRFSQRFAAFCLSKKAKTPFLADFYAFPHRLSAHFGACAGEISKFPTSLFVSMQSLCPSKWPLSGRNVATFGAESGHVRGRGSAEASQGSASSPSVMRTAWLKRHCLCCEHRVKVGSIN